MKCPNCGNEQENGLIECKKCQIIFSKWNERQIQLQPGHENIGNSAKKKFSTSYLKLFFIFLLLSTIIFGFYRYLISTKEFLGISIPKILMSKDDLETSEMLEKKVLDAERYKQRADRSAQESQKAIDSADQSMAEYDRRVNAIVKGMKGIPDIESAKQIVQTQMAAEFISKGGYSGIINKSIKETMPKIQEEIKNYQLSELNKTRPKSKSIFQSAQSNALSETKFLESMISIYYSDHEGLYPQGSNSDIFMELRKYGLVTDKDGKFNPQEEMLDPWGNPYQFVIPKSGRHGVYSFGPDKKDENGSGDDISSQSR